MERNGERFLRALGDHDHCRFILPWHLSNLMSQHVCLQLWITKLVVLLDVLCIRHVHGYPDTYLRGERKELNPDSVWLMGMRRPSGRKMKWKWVVNKISSWPGLCNVRGLLSMRLPQTHLCYSTLGKIPSLELCPAAHSPEPTWLQNCCGGQFHVQCQGPALRIYMKSIHFSASEGELTLKCRVIGALGQSSNKEG